MIVGILGGGQLARMLALAGIPLGMRFVILDPAPDACGGALGEHILAAYDDPSALARLAERCDRITYEFENVPASAVEWLASQERVVHPPPRALAVARDRLREKALFGELGIPTAGVEQVEDLPSLRRAVEAVGLPAVLKTRTLGYDGKGQVVLSQTQDIEDAWQRLSGVPAVLEAFVPFEREVSIIAVRGAGGQTSFYPLSENIHREGILVLARSRPGDPQQTRAEEYATRLLDALDYRGVLTVEFFDRDGELLANEIAPRVHNSGHWTIEGAVTSQFENHLRAVTDLPLGSTSPIGHAAMLNLIGDVPDPAPLLNLAGVHLHLYDKSSRPGRKVGHVTVRADTPESLDALVADVTAICA
ncbi:MAG: 5-(carboxyamino)imidazole ribonucleotide synthase [Actinomycetota bacterium]|nr:5-(carboxyamino)imidazole ribonucleotide synthase [Actinomycetota bacterium]